MICMYAPITQHLPHLRYEDHDFFVGVMKIVGKEIKAPSLYALFPVQLIEYPQFFHAAVATPSGHWQLETKLMDVLETSIDQVLPLLVYNSQGLSKGVSCLEGHSPPQIKW